MTDRRQFKALVRQRMERTGERYSTARLHVLDQRPTTSEPRLFPSVEAVGGGQPDLAAARNLLTNAGVVGPDGRPLTEAMAFGLAGGTGFLYGVFTYETGPTMTIVARNDSMPDPFLEPLFEAAGAMVDIQTTGGAPTAAKRIDAGLAAATPMLCTVGAGGLPYLGLPAEVSAMAPHVVGIVGHDPDNDTVLVDDRAPVPIPVSRQAWADAHGGYRKAKHRTITVTGTDPDHDWPRAVTEAVVRSTVGFDTPPVPQFAANIGLAGLEKWAGLLQDVGGAKGWARIFDQDRHAAIGLSRLYDCATSDYTAPGAGRPLHAQFLTEAAAVATEHAPILLAAAESFAASGQRWADLVEAVVDAHPEITEICALSDQLAAGLDELPDPDAMRALAQEKAARIQSASIPATVGLSLYPHLGAIVADVTEHERQGLATLSALDPTPARG